MAELKRLPLESVPAAIEKAERYRLLNEAREAECISSVSRSHGENITR